MHKRRPRYSGKNPRKFHEKYKELDPDRYGAEVQKVLASGKTPAGMHRPIMVDEVLHCLRPVPGDVVVDCTLGGGGHARALLERVTPGGRVIGLDVDAVELPRTEARLRESGVGADVFAAHLSNFAGVPKVLGAEGVDAADVVLADLGVSSMQLDNPDRGFSHKGSGPLDMRMSPTRGQPASALIARLSEVQLAAVLDDNADEPHAELIAGWLKRAIDEALSEDRAVKTAEVDALIRQGLLTAVPRLTEERAGRSVRRTFQALRIEVNDECSALDALLRVLPSCLAPGGRAAFLSFHSGEDRRVKKAFQAGYRSGVYSDVSDEVTRASSEERRANPRSSSAKLRWAIKATSPAC